MQNLIKICEQEIKVKEFRGQRVVTFKDIDMVHQRAEGTAKRNYVANKKHLKEGIDYFIVTKKELGTNFVLTYDFGKAAYMGTLITESGYLMLVKSFMDDLAWEVQRHLVNIYFKNRQTNNDNKQIVYADIPDNKGTQKIIQNLRQYICTLEGTLKLFNRYLELEKAKNYQTMIADIGIEIFLAADKIKNATIGVKRTN